MKNLSLTEFLFAVVKMTKWVEQCNNDVDLIEIQSPWRRWIYSNKQIINLLGLKNKHQLK